MNPSETDLAQLYRDGSSPASTCLSSEEIGLAADGALPRSHREAAADHLAACAQCARSYRAAREVRAWVDQLPDPATPPGRHAGATLRWVYAGVAATVLVAAAVVLPWAFRQPAVPAAPGAPAPLRGEGGEGAAAVRALLPDGATLGRENFVLRWAPLAPRARYRVTVATVDLVPIHTRSGLLTAEYRVPPVALAGLAPGTRLVWTIDGYLPDGQRLRSAMVQLRLK